MKTNTIKTFFALCLVGLLGASLLGSCDDGETYADQKNKERSAIRKFVKDNDQCGPIEEISEEQFAAQGYTTDVSRNQFVRFNSDGIYMQIVRQPEGKTLPEMAAETEKGEITKPIVCKFIEYDIRNAALSMSNAYITNTDEMMCTYNEQARSYTAYFTSGAMYTKYGSVVPKGWLKPLDYIHLTKIDGTEAKVRLIVPHTSGTANASSYVLPYYYEITYQLPANL